VPAPRFLFSANSRLPPEMNNLRVPSSADFVEACAPLRLAYTFAPVYPRALPLARTHGNGDDGMSFSRQKFFRTFFPPWFRLLFRVFFLWPAAGRYSHSCSQVSAEAGSTTLRGMPLSFFFLPPSFFHWFSPPPLLIRFPEPQRSLSFSMFLSPLKLRQVLPFFKDVDLSARSLPLARPFDPFSSTTTLFMP